MIPTFDPPTCERNVAQMPTEPGSAVDAQCTVDPFIEPLSLFTSQLGATANQILQLERSHLERIEKAATQLRDQIAADLQNRHREAFQTGIQVIREEFEEHMRSATAQWEAERQTLLNEIEHLRRTNSSELEQEVAQTEATLQTIEKKVQAMVDDSTVGLSLVMQEGAQQRELEAYLRGLKFTRRKV